MVRIGSRLGVVAIIALAWLPQDAGAQTAGLPAVAWDSGDVVPAPATPDPLTPKPQDDGPLLAPGAAATRPAMAAVADADPALAALLKSTTGSGGLGRGAAADWAALVAYYAESDGQPVWTGRQGLNARADAVIAELRRADDYGLRASSFDLPAALPVDASVEARAETEQRLSLAVLTYARHARGGRTDPPALSRMIDMRPRLFEPKSVLAAIAAAEEAGAYLRGLHPKHVEFQRLQRALAAERAAGAGQAQPGKSNAELVQRIVVNMERWRWMPEELGAFHVWDNVPEQITRVMDNGMVTLSEKIVVGKPNTPTPMFSANMA